MEIKTRHTPAFGVARIVLAAGESVQADPGAMIASTFGVTQAQAGRKGQATFTAPQNGGWVDLAPGHPGDIRLLDFDGRIGWAVVPERVLALPSTIHRDQSWPALQALFGGDTGFAAHYSGSGKLVLAAHGPVDAMTLDASEMITVRPGYLLAYQDGIQVRLRAADPSGPQSVRTGEGLLMDFAGPGTVVVQGRKAPGQTS